METASPSPTAVPYVPDQPKASNRSLTAIARGLTTAIETTNRRSASGLRSVARLETLPSATPSSDGSRTSAPGRLVTRASAHSAPRSSRVTVATAGPKSPVVEGPVSGAAPVAGASGPCQGEWVIGAPAGLTIREARPPRLRRRSAHRQGSGCCVGHLQGDYVALNRERFSASVANPDGDFVAFPELEIRHRLAVLGPNDNRVAEQQGHAEVVAVRWLNEIGRSGVLVAGADNAGHVRLSIGKLGDGPRLMSQRGPVGCWRWAI